MATRMKPPGDAEGFEDKAQTVLRRLRSSMAAVLGAISRQTPVRKPVDVQRALGIHYKLAWQLHKVAASDELRVEATNMPGPVAMQRFFDAAKKRGVPSRLIRSASEAMSEFNELVKTYAGDAVAFDSMVSGLAEEGAEPISLQQRRAAFKAQSHILGLQAQTHLAMFIFRPSEGDPNLLDAVVVRGLIGLQKYRRDASWTVATIKLENDDGSTREGDSPQPIAPADEARELGLMPRFCTHPLPHMKRMPRPDGAVSVVVEPSGLGMKSAVTCLLGHVFRNCQPRYRDESNRHQGAAVNVRTPCEVLIADVLVQRGLFAPMPPIFYTTSDHRGDTLTPLQRKNDWLPMREDVILMGHGLAALHTPDVPSYDELGKYVFERLRWNTEEFDVWRCRVEYPVMPSSVVVQFDLLEKPEA